MHNREIRISVIKSYCQEVEENAESITAKDRQTCKNMSGRKAVKKMLERKQLR